MQQSLAAPALTALLLGLSMACSSPEERFAGHVARGEEYAAQGELKKAVLEYHSALKIRPDDAEINERVGDLLREQRSPQDAAFFYREAHRLDPTRTGAVLKEARTLLFRDPRRAQQLVRQVLDANPDDADGQRTLSELALTRGNLNPALRAAEKATELDPESSAGWMQLGKVHLAFVREAQVAKQPLPAEHVDAALAAFTRADEAGDGYVHARLERARALALRPGSREEAARAYRGAVELALQQSDRATQVAAADAVREYASAVGDAELERWALRALLSVADGRLDAWSRLARLEGDPEAAERIYAELLAKRPEDPLAHITYANFLVQSGGSEGAISHLEEALEDGVESPLMWEQLLRLRLSRRLLADARATFVRMAEAYPDDPITRRAEARLALITGRNREAAEILRALVQEDETAESQRLLAQVEQRQGNLRRALAAVERSLTLEQTFVPETMELKARIHFDAREWGQAVSTLNEIVARGHPLSPRYRVLRGVALYELGNHELGRQALLRALEEPEPRADAAIEYARREGVHDPAGARAHLEKALQSHPTHTGLLEELTARDLRDGRDDAALERLNGVIESHRVSPSVLLLRADLLAHRGAWEGAEADALRAFEARPESPEALDLLFRIYVARGDVEEATRSFREAEQAGVLHAGARLLLGRLALHAGDRATARSMFEKVLEENPDMASAQSDLAFLLAQSGEDPERAITLARQAQEKLERNPGVTYRLGYVYRQGGRNEAALVELRRARDLADRAHESSLVPPIYYQMGLALRALERDQEALEAFETALTLDAGFAEADEARRQIDGLRAKGSS
jgi:tetratricopeptide (TPR) repeat protein